MAKNRAGILTKALVSENHS